MAVFTHDYLVQELTDLGEQLETPLTAYLIGGGALIFQGLRKETKDLDLVVRDGQALKRLCESLDKIGYDILPSSSPDLWRKAATVYIENKDGFRIDAFNQIVADNGELTNEMVNRSEVVFDAANLNIRVLANEDIFLLKKLTGRKSDVPDMNALIRAGINQKVIAMEMREQIDRRGRDMFARN